MTLSAGVRDGGVTSDPGYGSCWENQLHGAAWTHETCMNCAYETPAGGLRGPCWAGTGSSWDSSFP